MRKQRWLACLVTLAMFLTMIPGVVAADTHSQLPFTDVVGTNYETPVRALHQIGVVAGTSPTSFSPKSPVTRAQMAALLIRALNLKDATGDRFAAVFADVPESFWAFGEVMLAHRLGIVRGVTATEFQPNARVTYPQAAVMALRALGYDDGTLDYPAGYVVRANELGLIKGLAWSLSGEMTRGEVAVLLSNAVFSVPHKSFGLTLSQKYFRIPVSLGIEPAVSMIVAGETPLTAVGKDALGGQITGLNATWRVISGNATVSGSGQLNATSGTVVVEARSEGLVKTQAYTVVSQVSVTPQTATVKVGNALQLTARDGSATGPLLEGVTWSVVSGPGQIDGTGKLTSTGAGVIVARASLGKLSAAATVSAVTGLVVEPATAVVEVGGQVKYTVKTAEGQPFTGPVTWSVEGAGVIGQDGTFTAFSGTKPTIKVKSGELTGSATAQVVHRLVVSPASASLLQTKTQMFTVKGITTDGSEVSVPATWSSTARVGIVGGSGEFVATAPGTGKVTATYGKLTGSADVSVAGTPYAIHLSASRNSVPANGRSTVTLTATLKDASGLVVSMETPIQFYVNDTTKGTLSAATVKTSGGVATVTLTPTTTSGSFRVTAAATELSVLAGVVDLSSFAPVPAKIRLTAYPNPLAAAVNSRSTIKADLVDNEGYEITNNTGSTIGVTLSYTNTTAATLSANTIAILPGQSFGQILFTAGNAGDITLLGAATYPVENVVVKTVIAGQASKLAIKNDLVATRADGSTDLVVTVEVQDENGIVRTQDTGTAVSLSFSNDDGLTVPGVSVATVVQGVATFRVRHTVAGTYQMTASAGSLAASTAKATYTHGAAYGLKLAVVPSHNATSTEAKISADAATSVKLVAKVVDRYNNWVTDATGNVTFTRTSTANATTMPSTTTVSAVNGAAEISLTATVYPGTDVFKATSVGLQESNVVQVISNITGVPSRLAVTVQQAVVTAGSAATVTVAVQDAQGNPVTTATNRVITLNAASSSARVLGTGQVTAGVATFTVTDTKAGVLRLTATSEGLAGDTSKSVQFQYGAPASALLKLGGAEMTADGGQSTLALTAELQDAYGNVVPQAEALNLTLSRNDVVTLSGTSLFTGSLVYVRSTTNAGSVTISATGRVPVTPVVVSTFVPTAPARVKVEPVTDGTVAQGITVKVRILDAQGRTLTNQNTGTALSSVGLIISGYSGNTISITNNNLYGLTAFPANGTSHGTSGAYSGVASFTYTNTKPETVLITPVAYFGGTQLIADPAFITTKAGQPTQLAVTSSRLGLSSDSSEAATIEAVLKDGANNVASSAEQDTFTITFSSSNFVTTSEPGTIQTNTGRINFTVNSRAHSSGGTTVITVVSAKTGLSGQVTIITDRPPGSPILFATDSGGVDATVAIGDPGARIVVTVEPRNTPQSVVAYVNGSQVPLYNAAVGGSAVGAVAANQTSLVAYLRRLDLGSAGTKSIRVVVQNEVASSPLSNIQTITVE